MAQTFEEIIGRRIDSVKELKKYQDQLRGSLINLDKDSEEYKKTVEQLDAVGQKYVEVTKVSAKENQAAADSIRGMEKEYGELYKQYKLLSEEERSSPVGKEMAENLAKLSESVNNAKKEVGNYTSNVGNYSNSIVDAFEKMGGSVGGLVSPLKNARMAMATLNTTMKANPVGLVVAAIAALIAIFKKLKEAVGKNEELQNRWNVAMASFKPIGDAVANIMDKLAGILVSGIEIWVKYTEAVRKAVAAVTDFLGITKGAKKEVEESIESHKELAKRTNELTKARREANVEASKKTAEIERLREEASETENLTEKKAKLEEAKRLQKEIDDENIRLAREELDILQAYAEKTANAAEDNEKLAAAQAKVNAAIAQGETNMRNYNKQINAVSKSTGSAKSGLDSMRQKAEELAKQLEKENRTELQNLERKYKEEKALLEKYGYDTVLLTRKYEKEREDIRKKNDRERYSRMAASARRENELYNNLRSMAKEAGQSTAEMDVKRYGERVAAVKRLEAALKKLPETEGMDEGLAAAIQKNTTLVDGLGRSYTNVKTEVGLAVTELKAASSAVDGMGISVKSLEETTAALEVEMKNLAEAKGAKALEDMNRELVKMGPIMEGVIGSYDLSTFLQKFGDMESKFRKTREGILKPDDKSWEYILENWGFLLPEDKWGKVRSRMDATYARFAEMARDGMEAAAGKTGRDFMTLLASEIAAEGEPVLDTMRETMTEALDAVWDEGDAQGALDQYQNYLNTLTYMDALALDNRITTLRDYMENFEGTTEQRIELENQLAEAENERMERKAALIQRELDLESQLKDSIFDAITATHDSTISLMNSIAQVDKAMVDSGKLDEKEKKKREKRLERLQKAQVAITVLQIMGDAAKASMDLWKNFAAELPLNAETAAAAGVGAVAAKAALDAKSLASTILKQTAIASQAAAQIAAARGGYLASTASESMSAGETPSVSPTLIDSTAIQYAQEQQAAAEQDNLQERPIVVQVVDIAEGLNAQHVKVVESSF